MQIHPSFSPLRCIFLSSALPLPPPPPGAETPSTFCTSSCWASALQNLKRGASTPAGRRDNQGTGRLLGDRERYLVSFYSPSHVRVLGIASFTPHPSFSFSLSPSIPCFILGFASDLIPILGSCHIHKSVFPCLIRTLALFLSCTLFCSPLTISLLLHILSNV